MNVRGEVAEINVVLFNQILRDVFQERKRQERLRADGKFVATCATMNDDQMPESECYVVLGEEFGEVGRAIIELDYQHGDAVGASNETVAHLRAELIQVAAVCAAWVERLDYYDATLMS
jgi:hypothetical protein